MSTEPEFTRSARPPQITIDDPYLSWATGLPTTDKRIYVGWMLEAGKHAELDASMSAAGFAQVTIKHGSGNVVTHWAVETANAFVIADGVQSPQECKRSEDRFGIAYGWHVMDDGRSQSKIKLRVLLRELLLVDCYEVLTISVKSTMSQDMIDALLVQYAVLNAVDQYRADDGKPALNPPFYACCIPLGAGAASVRGSGASTREIVPPAALIPNPITKEYIRANWIKRDWTRYIDSIIEDTIRWSVEESRRIVAGSDAA